jgi:hypothetical protein
MSDIRMKAWHIQNFIEVEDDIQVVPLSCASEFINKLKSDQCKFCVVRGDIEKCKATDCSIHENWYSLEQKKSIESLEKRVKELDYELIERAECDDIEFNENEILKAENKRLLGYIETLAICIEKYGRDKPLNYTQDYDGSYLGPTTERVKSDLDEYVLPLTKTDNRES